MAKSMIHLNGNILCAIDVETTGFSAKRHEIIQICVLPLDSNLLPNKEYLPFYIDMKPEKVENIDPDAMKVNKARLANLVLNGMDHDQAADLFYDWTKKLDIPMGKKISPLAHNWVFDRGFMIEWLGQSMFDDLVDFRYRDLMPATLYCNDRADFNAEKIPYPKHSLKYICTVLGVQYDEATQHDALADCIATAAAYKALMKGIF